MANAGAAKWLKPFKKPLAGNCSLPQECQRWALHSCRGCVALSGGRLSSALFREVSDVFSPSDTDLWYAGVSDVDLVQKKNKKSQLVTLQHRGGFTLSFESIQSFTPGATFQFVSIIHWRSTLWSDILIGSGESNDSRSPSFSFQRWRVWPEGLCGVWETDENSTIEGFPY